MVKLRLIALLAILVFWLAAAQIPTWVIDTAQTVQVIRPTVEMYTPQIVTGGSLQSGNVMEVYLSQGIIPSQVYVKPGDWVEKGALMATVDTEATAAFKNVTATEIPTTPNITDSIPEEYAALAQAFGMTEQLNELLEIQSPDVGQSETMEEVGEEIIAPVGGIITEVEMVQGRLSQGGSCVATISQTGCDTALVSINEYDLSQIEVGDSVTLTGVGLGDNIYSGYISRIYPTAEKRSTGLTTATMVDMEVRIQNPDNALLPGLSVSATINLEEPAPQLVVPYQAVGQDEYGNEFVYVMKDGQPHKQIIKIERELAHGVSVIEGLSGDEVLLYDTENFDPQQSYKISYLTNWGSVN